MQALTFEQLPNAVVELIRKVDHLTTLLADLSAQPLVNSSVDSPDLITIKPAAEVVQLAVPTIYGMVGRNEIPFMKKGKKLYFSRQELEDWIRDGRKKTTAECTSEVRADLNSRKP